MKRFLFMTRRVLAWMALTVVCIVLLGFGYERVQRATSHGAYPPPGTLVEVEGRRMHLDCEGTGSPTVLLEAGQDVRGSLSWYPIKSDVATLTRVCAYDRAGILWSERARGPRTSPAITHELSVLLDEAGEGGPFVMVGHSMGAIHTRNFADLNRASISGLVFVDPSHPEQLDHLPAEMIGQPPALIRGVVKFLNGAGLFRFVQLGPSTAMPDSINAILTRFRPSSNVGLWAEFDVSAESLRSAADSPGFGDLPLVVLTSGAKPSFAPQDLFERTHAVMVELHHDLAALSTSGVHRIVPDAAHYIHEDRPDAVVEAIAEVVAAAR